MNKTPKVKLCSVNPEDIISVNSAGTFLGGVKMTEAEIKNLKAEAEMIENMRLWAIMTNTLGDAARKTMFERSLTFDDMKTGKLILYAIDVQKNIIETVKNAKP